jgi:FSR family fosmidomycin resistance protein-like MFS transporter
MDGAPERHEQNMAHWVFAGSVGVVVGPLALGAATALGLGWRGLYLVFAGLTVVLLGITCRVYSPAPPSASKSSSSVVSSLKEGVANTLHALQRREVLRWLTLLAFSDLMLDILRGFLARYFVDVVGATPAQAGMAVAAWTGMALVDDPLLVPLLECVRGPSSLRLSAATAMVPLPV